MRATAEWRRTARTAEERSTTGRLSAQYPGANAEKPTRSPPRGGGRSCARPQGVQCRPDALIAAGVAFYAFLSLVPTLIAATPVYGLVTTPEPRSRARIRA